MKKLQLPISDKHKSAMFFHGVVAVSDNYNLVTYQSGEILYEFNMYVGAEIRKLGRLHIINDMDMTEGIDSNVDILVDKFFCLYDNKTHSMVDCDIFCYDDFDEAIIEFNKFLEKNEVFKFITL